MRYLADTHLLLWAGLHPSKLSKAATKILENSEHEILFSTVSVWEVAIKHSLNRESFMMPPESFRRGLLARGCIELSITSEHAMAVASLPAHHADPFDRMLVAQAILERVTLLTSDKKLALYPRTERV
jgi:PIN domain nuclease of toxin-antitoxin system